MPSYTADDSSPTTPNSQENRLRTMPKFLYSFLPYWIRSVFRSIYFLIVRKPSLKSSEAKRQKPLGDQHARAIEAALDILENVTGKRTGITLPDTPWAANKRIPYLYYINNQKTILIILQGDITRTKVDAIVNAANEHMTGGGGVDGIIHDAAGEQLYEACKAHKQIYQGVRLPTGHSRILLSYDMSNTTYYIINTAGPRYSRYRADDCADELKSCYKTALALAGLYDLESVGFTAISCGIFGYPVDEGAKVALETVDKEAGSVPVVVFVLWDDHIYDAWKRTAAELKFTPINPNKLQTKESTTTATADEKESGVEQPRVTTVSDQPIDESSTQETEQPIAEDLANVISRLPSVPKDEPDTQNMDSQDTEENDFHEAKPLLTTQKTAEMTDVNREKENSTENRGQPSDKVDENPTETKSSTTPITSKDNSD